MILVRNRNGTLYFLAREGGEALDALRRAYPGKPLAVVKEGDGLAILRVGEVTPDGAGDERLAIVNLTLPPAPPAFSFRARGSATPLQ
ncbi:MAG: hypothetical protein KJ062_18300 [Thermoanaerobaculia bacterium]|nr:hypothetical protein [Thermoanaerobaculia bacterium]